MSDKVFSVKPKDKPKKKGKLIFSNERLLEAINSEDYDTIDKLSRMSKTHKIKIIEFVCDAAKEKNIVIVKLLLHYAYDTQNTFLSNIKSDDEYEIIKYILDLFEVKISFNNLLNAIVNDCYKILNLILDYIEENDTRDVYFLYEEYVYFILQRAFKYDRKKILKHLQSRHAVKNGEYIFDKALRRLDLKLATFFFRRSYIMPHVALNVINNHITTITGEYNYRFSKLISLVVLKMGIEIDMLSDKVSDEILLYLYKFDIDFFGKFNKRLGIILIREYAVHNTVRDTLTDLPDELVGLIMGF